MCEGFRRIGQDDAPDCVAGLAGTAAQHQPDTQEVIQTVPVRREEVRKEQIEVDEGETDVRDDRRP